MITWQQFWSLIVLIFLIIIVLAVAKLAWGWI